MRNTVYIKKYIEELPKLLEEKKYQEIVNTCEEIINLSELQSIEEEYNYKE